MSFPINIIWTIYKLLFEESKSVILEKELNEVIMPGELNVLS